eukprot:gene857-5717_t
MLNMTLLEAAASGGVVLSLPSAPQPPSTSTVSDSIHVSKAEMSESLASIADGGLRRSRPEHRHLRQSGPDGQAHELMHHHGKLDQDA